jgi:hypothetical protein
LEPYDALMANVWERLVRLLGIHTVLVLVERAHWMARESYNEASHISYGETGVSFSQLAATVKPERAREVATEFVGSLMSIMTRLVGLDISRRIAEELDTLIGREDRPCTE